MDSKTTAARYEVQPTVQSFAFEKGILSATRGTIDEHSRAAGTMSMFFVD